MTFFFRTISHYPSNIDGGGSLSHNGIDHHQLERILELSDKFEQFINKIETSLIFVTPCYEMQLLHEEVSSIEVVLAQSTNTLMIALLW